MKFLRSLSCKRYRPWNFPVMIYFLQKCETHDKTHFQGDISWYIENEEIPSEVHRVEGFNSMNLWRNFFVRYVSRDIALEMWKFVVCYTFLQKINHDRKVSRAISLATLRTKKFHQRFVELKASTLWISDEISSFAQHQEKSSPGKIFLTKFLQNSKLWHRSWVHTPIFDINYVHALEKFDAYGSRYRKSLLYFDL